MAVELSLWRKVDSKFIFFELIQISLNYYLRKLIMIFNHAKVTSVREPLTQASLDPVGGSRNYCCKVERS